jgi:hypothetical protein
MGDLKTPYTNPVYPNTTDMGGDTVVTRGTDPNAEGDNGAGAQLQGFWPVRALPENLNLGLSESPNSVSGLPPLPNRFEPAADTVEPPDLTDRNPGTIDKQ